MRASSRRITSLFKRGAWLAALSFTAALGAIYGVASAQNKDEATEQPITVTLPDGGTLATGKIKLTGHASTENPPTASFRVLLENKAGKHFQYWADIAFQPTEAPHKCTIPVDVPATGNGVATKTCFAPKSFDSFKATGHYVLLSESK